MSLRDTIHIGQLIFADELQEMAVAAVGRELTEDEILLVDEYVHDDETLRATLRNVTTRAIQDAVNATARDS